jgi:nitroimidazol reductase NimA-like FMN-containing flavoprotein (pyridoxamine 5'-phosphate oxidase superfamily)
VGGDRDPAAPPSGGTVSDRIRIRREMERARYEDADVAAVLEAGTLAHVGCNAEHGVVVIPMLYAPCPGGLYLHGSPGSGVLRTVRSVPACVTVTLFDGLVVARSTFMTSANYRSVVAFGHARRLSGDEKLAALDVLLEHLLPGRGAEVRPSTRAELHQTGVLHFEIEEASVKVREGAVEDHPEDVDPSVWAGVIPTPFVATAPIASADVAPDVAVPPSVAAYVARHRRAPGAG